MMFFLSSECAFCLFLLFHFTRNMLFYVCAHQNGIELATKKNNVMNENEKGRWKKMPDEIDAI